MNRTSHLLRLGTLAGAALLAATSASAQSAGTLLVKLGVNRIAPEVTSDPLSPPALPNTTIDVKPAASLILTAAYMWTDNVSVEFFGGLPYKHDLVATGAIDGVGVIGQIKQISPTVLAQYRFGSARSMVRPYVGLGPTYGYVFATEGTAALTALTNPGGPPTTMSVDGAWGVTMQLGASMEIDRNWFVDAALMKTKLTTTTHLSTGQSIKTALDPLSFGVSLGYRF